MPEIKEKISPELIDEKIKIQRDKLKLTDEAMIKLGDEVGRNRDLFDEILKQKNLIQAEINKLTKAKKAFEENAGPGKDEEKENRTDNGPDYAAMLAAEKKIRILPLKELTESETAHRDTIKDQAIKEEKKNFAASPRSYEYAGTEAAGKIAYSAYSEIYAGFMDSRGIKDEAILRKGKSQFIEAVSGSRFDKCFNDELNKIMNPLNFTKEKERRRSFDGGFVTEKKDKAFGRAVKSLIGEAAEAIAAGDREKAEKSIAALEKHEKLAGLMGSEEVYMTKGSTGKTLKETADSIKRKFEKMPEAANKKPNIIRK